jgi:hypothetical protein
MSSPAYEWASMLLRITVFAEEELEAVFGNLKGGQQAADGVADAVG